MEAVDKNINYFSKLVAHSSGLQNEDLDDLSIGILKLSLDRAGQALKGNVLQKNIIEYTDKNLNKKYMKDIEHDIDTLIDGICSYESEFLGAKRFINLLKENDLNI